MLAGISTYKLITIVSRSMLATEDTHTLLAYIARYTRELIASLNNLIDPQPPLRAEEEERLREEWRIIHSAFITLIIVYSFRFIIELP